MNSVYMQRKIQDLIFSLLSNQLAASNSQPGTPDFLTRIDIYQTICKMSAAASQNPGTLGLINAEMTAGTFNNVVDQMKKVGLIGVAKGGQHLFIASAEHAVQS